MQWKAHQSCTLHEAQHEHAGQPLIDGLGIVIHPISWLTGETIRHLVKHLHSTSCYIAFYAVRHTIHQLFNVQLNLRNTRRFRAFPRGFTWALHSAHIRIVSCHSNVRLQAEVPKLVRWASLVQSSYLSGSMKGFETLSCSLSRIHQYSIQMKARAGLGASCTRSCKTAVVVAGGVLATKPMASSRSRDGFEMIGGWPHFA